MQMTAIIMKSAFKESIMMVSNFALVHKMVNVIVNDIIK